MNLIISGGIDVCKSLLISLWMFTVSKALLMSSDTRTVRDGGRFSLKPLVMVLTMLCKAESVE